MKNRIRTALVLTLAAIPSVAFAQDEPAKGAYGVVRAGVAIDTDARFPANDTTAPATIQRNTDHKPGFTGELGMGYDFGAFRLEGTAGYATAKLDSPRASAGGFVTNGRTKAFTLGLSGYLDIETGSAVTPYVGAGIGASRVDMRSSRLGGTPSAGSRFDDKDWGLNWHADAGVGIAAGRSTTIDIGARYSRTSKLEFDGRTGLVTGTPPALADTFRPRLSSWSAMIGLRQAF
ncbi:MAG: outer membrane beta-barrel protein [Alphaproteobacteria bacterium]|nr:outer membrane beta-barrel protein [Alphaproteobacteria bacterium]MBU0794356.1 outer membrane beta-barrel protein [Alphaproteobacteria bacterium]MBU0875233.1 outer membrane beta-barrel protein [Alphaproteobacteria bacterium]MBU1768982.1 outer membrane beta-barrel protein [Alphaproteobacteria bacterium]